MDELRSRLSYQRDLKNCNVLCFSESWLNKNMVTEDVHCIIRGHYDFVCRGMVSVKGKGQMLTYLLEGRNLDCSRTSRYNRSANSNIRTKLSPAPTRDRLCHYAEPRHSPRSNHLHQQHHPLPAICG
ncbi:uncharacterized protein ACWYII_040858 [Salvelinus alpinus]